MATIYIDPSAAVNGSGTFSSPYNTWASAPTWVAGNSYLQKESTVFAGTIGPLGTGGTAGSRITVGVYSATDGSQITGVRGAAVVNATGQSFGFNITGTRPYITIEGFEIYGATSANITKTATTKAEDQYCEFRSLILRDGVSDGLLANGKGNKIVGCVIYGNAQDGIRCVGDDLVIENCHVYGNGTTNSNGDCVQLLNCNTPLIQNNIFDHSQSSYKQSFIHNRDDGASTGGRIVGNQISCAQYVSGVTSALKTLYIGVPNVTVERNTIIGGEFAAYLIETSVTFRANLVIATGSGPVVGVAVRANSISVSGNTVVGGNGLAGSIGIDHSTTYTGVTINNNVAKSWPVGIRTAASGATYSHNSFLDCTVRNGNASSAEQAAGTGDVVADPLLTASYRPMPGSPLLSAGTHLGFQRDVMGIQRPNPPSIGAFDRATFRARL